MSATLSAVLGFACSGSIGSSGGGNAATGNDDQTGNGAGSNGTNGGGGTHGGSSNNGGSGTAVAGDPSINALSCNTTGTAASDAPLRRLTNLQYTNTLTDLLAGYTTVPSDLSLPNETLVAGFDDNYQAQTSTLALLQGYQSAASTMAKAVTGNTTMLGKLAPCASGADPVTCGTTFINSFGKRAFRRPLTSDETTRLVTLFKTINTPYGYGPAIESTLESMLMAPQFVFRPEFGTSSGNVLQLTNYEVASRLSYFLWDTMPDTALMAAADAGSLSTAAGITTQANRLLGDNRAHAVVAKFHQQWMQLNKRGQIVKDPAAFPKFNANVLASMQSTLAQYIDHVFWGDGKLSTLLTDTHAYVDSNLAWVYGVNAPASGTSLIDLGGNRSGLLTQAAVLTAFAKPAVDSPVYRGVFVLDQVLCSPTPPPPPNVPALPDPKPGDAPMTTRARLEQSHALASCQGCHKSIDGAGFAFEHFDAVGGYRDKDNGIAVDSSGQLVGTRDIDGTFNGVVDLGKKLGSSSQVEQCLATQWFRYGFGRTESSADDCALKPIVDAFTNSKGDMKGLLLTMVTSDAFRFRTPPQ